jgi:hypothetical protein
MYTKPLESADDYFDMVGNLAYLIDECLRPIELMIDSGQVDDEMLLMRLPAFISLTNTIGYLRGRESIFNDLLPADSMRYHEQVRATESNLEARLGAIIQYLKTTGKTPRAIEVLSQYFLI